MEHVPTSEADIEKVYRIAREMGISLEEAAVTCDAFHLAFSDQSLRRSIFAMIDELDESATRKGEPLGLIITYAVELGMDGIWVGRYADEIPPGEIVELTPMNRARILLRIKDNFSTQEVLGPMILNRPGWHFDTFDPDAQIPEDFSHLEPGRQPICLGPIRLKLDERFTFLSPASSKSRCGSFKPSADRTDLNPPDHLPLWAALQAGMLALQSTSGLSPPRAVGECIHSERKMSPGPWH